MYPRSSVLLKTFLFVACLGTLPTLPAGAETDLSEVTGVNLPGITPPGKDAGTTTDAQATPPINFEESEAKVREIYIKLNSAIEQLAQTIADGLFPNIDKPKALNAITVMRGHTMGVLRESYLKADVTEHYKLLQTADTISEYLIKQIHTGLTDFTPENVEALMSTRSGGVDVTATAEELEAQLAVNKDQAKELDVALQNAGVYWYNRVYRLFNKYGLEKHPTLLKVAAGSALVGGMGAYMYWLSDTGTKPSHEAATRFNIAYAKLLEERKNFYAAEYGEAIRDVINDLPPQVLANLKNDRHIGLEKSLFRNIFGFPSQNERRADIYYHLRQAYPQWLANFHDNIAIGALRSPWIVSAMAAAGTALVTAKDSIVNKISVKLRNFHNKAMGGVYRTLEAHDASQSFTFTPIDLSCRFDNMIGQQGIMEGQMIVELMTNPNTRNTLALQPYRGWVFDGEPGTGKTMLTKAIAAELFIRLKQQNIHLTCFEVSASEVVRGGVTSLWNFAKRHAPCIIIVNEADLLGLSRVGDNKTLSEFLDTMGDLSNENPEKMMLTLFTTNRIEAFDAAVRRPGRMFGSVHFKLPGKDVRKEFMAHKLAKLAADPKDFDLEQLAQETDGRSFADLEMMINDAVKLARQMNLPLTHAHLYDTLNMTLRRIRPTVDEKIIPQEKQLIAAYQVGKALSIELLGNITRVGLITTHRIDPLVKEVPEFVKHTTATPPKVVPVMYGDVFTYRPMDIVTAEEPRSVQCKIKLAGPIAQKILLPNLSGFAANYRPDDRKKALELALNIVSDMDTADLHALPEQQKNKFYEQAFALLTKYEDDVIALFNKNKVALGYLMDLLVKEQMLPGIAIAGVLKEVEEALATQAAEKAANLPASAADGDPAANEPTSSFAEASDSAKATSDTTADPAYAKGSGGQSTAEVAVA